MPRVYVPEDLRTKMTYSSQTLWIYIITNLPICDIGEHETNDDFRFAQELVLHWKHFVDNKILSKTKFYEGLNQLMDLDILHTSEELPKNQYVVNPYYIDNLNKYQRKSLNKYRRLALTEDVVNNIDQNNLSKDGVILVKAYAVDTSTDDKLG